MVTECHPFVTSPKIRGIPSQRQPTQRRRGGGRGGGIPITSPPSSWHHPQPEHTPPHDVILSLSIPLLMTSSSAWAYPSSWRHPQPEHTPPRDIILSLSISLLMTSSSAWAYPSSWRHPSSPSSSKKPQPHAAPCDWLPKTPSSWRHSRTTFPLPHQYSTPLRTRILSTFCNFL